MNSINTSRSLSRRGFVGAAAGIGAAGLLGRPTTASAAASESRTRVETIELGKVTVTRVMEYSGPVGMTSRQFFPGSPKELWEENEDWLSPDFWEPGTDMVYSALQTWVLRSGGQDGPDRHRCRERQVPSVRQAVAVHGHGLPAPSVPRGSQAGGRRRRCQHPPAQRPRRLEHPARGP
jgi:hypothetical protein